MLDLTKQNSQVAELVDASVGKILGMIQLVYHTH